MTVPRDITENTTYLISRRVCQRQLLLRPDFLLNSVFLFCLAHAAALTGVALHAVVCMGNHYHAVLTDVEGRLPEFLEWFHKITAKCVNAKHGRWENMWSSEQTSVVRLESPADVMDKVLYSLANPVAAALVHKSSDWPGVVSSPESWTQAPIEIQRPSIFFDKNGQIPETATLGFVRPPGFDDIDDETLVEEIREELDLREMDIRLQHKKAGRFILGRRGVLAQDPKSFPLSIEPRRTLNPTIAAKNKWRRIEAIQRRWGFIQAHAAALGRFKAGHRDVIFPHGTYWYRRFVKVRVAPG